MFRGLGNHLRADFRWDRTVGGGSRKRVVSWPRLGAGLVIAIGTVATVSATAVPADAASLPSTWTQATPATSPATPGLSFASMSDDPANGGSLLFGGENGSVYQNGTWLWNGTTWDEQAPATSPSPRIEASMARTATGVVLFGGYDGTNYLADTWTWDGSTDTWTQQNPATSPPARDGATIAYYDGQVVLFGGYNGTSYLGDTWIWDGTNWTQQTLTTSPPARAYASLAEDPNTNAPVLFGGSNGTSYLNDTWTWSVSGWTQQNPAASPPARAYGSMDYDAAIGQPVLFGGEAGATTYLGDTWTWDGSNWTAQSPTTSPLARGYASVADDSTAGQLVLFGGQSAMGAASILDDTWTFAAAPGAPTGTAATGGNAQASVAFTTPSFNGGSGVTSYTVTATDSTTPANGGQTQTGATSPLVVTGLTNGDSYTFAVTATNGVGTGPASAASNSVVPSGVPGAPTIGTATRGNAQAKVTFTAPASDGGSSITSYTVTASDSTTAGNGGQTKSGASSPITVTGLTNGDSYTFTVTATNGTGTGPASSASNAVVPATVPGAPTIGTATRGNAQAKVTFTAPASDGGSSITSYTVTATDSTTPGNGGQTKSGTSSPITVTGLTNGNRYTFTVTATNGAGTGPASAPSNAAVPATLPGAPTIGAATRGNAEAKVAFTAPASNGGSAITSYTVTARDSTTPGNGGQTKTGASSPITVTGLTNGNSYTFTVTATNGIGTGPASGASKAVVPATVPRAPSVGTATAGNARATVTFSPPSSDSGSAITSYRVTAHDSTTPGNGGQTRSGKGSPLTVTGLTNGDSYTFTVTATNGVGTGPASGSSNAVVPATVPGVPTIGTVTRGNDRASVTFTAPSSDGGLAITSYTVTATDSTNPANGGQTQTGTSSPITVTGLTNGDSYTFTVTATNGAGTGPASAPSSAEVPATLPGAPTIGTATAGNARASVTFTAPSSDGGAAITSYTVTAHDSTHPGRVVRLRRARAVRWSSPG